MSFLRDMLSNKDNVSSKRVMGIILILSFVLVLAYSIPATLELTTKELATTSLFAGIGLLGLGVIDKNLKINNK